VVEDKGAAYVTQIQERKEVEAGSSLISRAPFSVDFSFCFCSWSTIFGKKSSYPGHLALSLVILYSLPTIEEGQASID
jgi:hypothetical protein